MGSYVRAAELFEFMAPMTEPLLRRRCGSFGTRVLNEID